MIKQIIGIVLSILLLLIAGVIALGFAEKAQNKKDAEEYLSARQDSVDQLAGVQLSKLLASEKGQKFDAEYSSTYAANCEQVQQIKDDMPKKVALSDNEQVKQVEANYSLKQLRDDTDRYYDACRHYYMLQEYLRNRDDVVKQSQEYKSFNESCDGKDCYKSETREKYIPYYQENLVDPAVETAKQYKDMSCPLVQDGGETYCTLLVQYSLANADYYKAILKGMKDDERSTPLIQTTSDKLKTSSKMTQKQVKEMTESGKATDIYIKAFLELENNFSVS